MQTICLHSSFNLIGAEDNILATARADAGTVGFYVYTKDLRESTINMVGSDGTSPVTYNYTDYGETEVLGNQDFYNEVCYSAGIYDKTTGLYYLNARYYSPENGAFLTQDTYRGDRSRTYTLNYYAYCAGNPIAYTDPSGHAIWGVVGAAMGAYDGYKYAKKKNLKGWKKAAAIVGGAALGAVNPFKVVKAAKKVVKAAKYTKKALSSTKKLKAAGKALKKTKTTKVKKIKNNGKTVTVKTKKLKKTTYKKDKNITTSTKKSSAAKLDAKSEVTKTICAPAIKATFASEEKLYEHYIKHVDEFEGAFNNPKEYLKGAQDVMEKGYAVDYMYKGEKRTGYVQFYGNSRRTGNAKFAFVGTNSHGNITTFHIKSGKEFWKTLNGRNIPVINPK